MGTKEIKRIFYAVGNMEADKKSVLDQNGRKHTLTLKESLCWVLLRGYPMDEEDFISTYILHINYKRLGIYMDEHEAMRVLDRMLSKGVVIMGVGKEPYEEVTDMLGQLILKENKNFKEVAKDMLSTFSFISLLSAYRDRKSAEAKKLIELFEKGYSVHDILKDVTLTEGVFSEEEKVLIPIVTECLLTSQIIVEKGCYIRKYNKLEVG